MSDLDADPDHNDQYEYLLRQPQAPIRSSQPKAIQAIKIRVADKYEWTIDKTPLTEKSKFFNIMMSKGWKVGHQRTPSSPTSSLSFH